MPGSGSLATARYGLALTMNRLFRQSDVSVIRTERLTITSHCGPAPVQIDGESAGQLPCEISLSPYPVRLMVPRAYLGVPQPDVAGKPKQMETNGTKTLPYFPQE
jgi:hypothetical protein